MPHPPAAPCLPLALLACGLLGSCGDGGRALHLGGVGSRTGEAASFGISHHRAMLMAVAEWNARGGVLGEPVRLHYADDQGDPAEGAAAFHRLVRRTRVAAIVGAGLSRVSLAGAPICQAAGVPMVAPSSTHRRVTATGNCIFRVCFLDACQGGAAARFAVRDLRARRAACLFDLGNETGADQAEAFRQAFQSLGGTVAAFQGHAPGSLHFLPQLTRILATRPDLLYLPGTYNDAAIIARQARDLGYRGRLLGGDGWDSAQLLQAGGKAIDGACFTTHVCPDDPDPRARAFVANYRARYGEAPDGHAHLAYDATCLVLDAVRRAGSKDPRAIRQALLAADLEGTAGRIRFDPGRNPGKPVRIVQVQDGRLTCPRTAPS